MARKTRSARVDVVCRPTAAGSRFLRSGSEEQQRALTRFVGEQRMTMRSRISVVFEAASEVLEASSGRIRLERVCFETWRARTEEGADRSLEGRTVLAGDPPIARVVEVGSGPEPTALASEWLEAMCLPERHGAEVARLDPPGPVRPGDRWPLDLGRLATEYLRGARLDARASQATASLAQLREEGRGLVATIEARAVLRLRSVPALELPWRAGGFLRLAISDERCLPSDPWSSRLTVRAAMDGEAVLESADTSRSARIAVSWRRIACLLEAAHPATSP